MNSKWFFVALAFVFALILYITFKVDVHRNLPYSETYCWGALGFTVLGILLAIFKK